MVQSVEPPTLDLGPGHDLTVQGLEPGIGLCANGSDPAWDSVSPSLCPSTACHHPLKINKLLKKVFFNSNDNILRGLLYGRQCSNPYCALSH